METFATTRPIFDRMTNVYGYDLMFRTGFETYFNAAVADALQADLQDAMTFTDIVGLCGPTWCSRPVCWPRRCPSRFRRTR